MSIFRLGLIGAAVGVFIIIAGIVIFNLERASRRQPLEIAVPESANFLVREELFGSGQRLYYQTSDNPESVAAFYTRLMQEFYNDDSQGCVRLPPGSDTVNSNYSEGNGVVPFEYRCFFDNSSTDITQHTEILIQPGVRNDQTGEDFTGTTRIEHEQYWEP